eukprot:TRINITY_DN6576_c1_g1_i1.p1 TRINITY_DN6576_c1_g1~~TRINITY_DN6576_c1_g1_i1.p1  ORF type:complete len:283 (+),score=54.45 TRINITY_DN6576_c1_g1_i1:104-952(+)
MGEVGYSLCSEPLTLAVVDLLSQRAAQFQQGEDPATRLDALRALRLMFLGPPISSDAKHWWVEVDLGYDTHAESRRYMVEEIFSTLVDLTKTMPFDPIAKTVAFGCLRYLCETSQSCLNHLIQSDVISVVVAALYAEAKTKGQRPIAEDFFVEGLELLRALSVGPRAHLRKLAEAGVDKLATYLFQIYKLHRRIVCSAFTLLAVVYSDETCIDVQIDRRREASEEAHEAAQRWPKELKEACQNQKQLLCSRLVGFLPKTGGEEAAPAATALALKSIVGRSIK